MPDASMRGLVLCALTSLCPPAFADVLFSEYIEGSSFNKVVEVHNNGSEAVDLGAGGYRLELYSNGSATVTSSADLGATLGAGEVLVVCNGDADAAVLAVCDLQSGTVNFNGDDAFALRSGGASGPLVDVIGQIGFDPGSRWGDGDRSTQDHTLRRLAAVSSGDSDGGDPFDPAAEWAGFAIDRFDGLGCPGVEACEGGGGPEPLALSIPEIQGAAHISAYDGQRVVTQGVVTAVGDAGFYLQDASGDEDPATSDAIYVYTASAPAVAVGDSVELSGTVDEYRPGGVATGNLTITELTSPSVAALAEPLGAIAPTLLGAGGRVPPALHIDNDTVGSVENPAQTTYDPAEDGIDFYESLEAMLVRIEDARVVAPTNDFGELWVVAGGAADASGINPRGGITQTEDGGSVDYNPERIQLDADFGPEPPPARPGDSIAQLEGVFSYAFGNFEVLLTQIGAVGSGGLEPETSELLADFGGLTIAGYNVENLDPNDEDSNTTAGGCPDADVAEGRFDAIAVQIVANLGAPDIVALQEVQDNSGCDDDGIVASDATRAALTAAISAAGGPAYESFDIAPVDGADGGAPGGNIRVAYLYDPQRVSLIEGTQGAGDSSTGTEPTEAEGGLALTLSPGRIDPTNPAWTATRKSLAALFEFKGQRLLLINNHWSSKGGGTPLFGAQQPAVNGSQEDREAQAAVVKAFVDAALAVDAGAQIVVLGDLNEFSFMPPLQILRGSEPQVLFDLADELLPPLERYSYVYDGNSQTLDHVLVSSALRERTEFDFVHVNAEFVGAISDHDPALIRISYDATPEPFDFGTVEDVAAGEAVSSGTVTLGGFELPLPVTIEGGQYSLNGGDFTDAAGTAEAGDQLRLRVTASETYGQTVTATLSVGETAGSFAVTTAEDGAGGDDGGDDEDDDDGGALGLGLLLMLAGALLRRLR